MVAYIMGQNRYFRELFVFIILVFVALKGIAFAENNNYKLEFINHRLSIEAQEAPLGLLLKEIEDKTGIKFIIGEREFKKTFSGHFQSLPIDKALERILYNFDRAIIYTNGKIQMVKIVSKGSISSMPQIAGDHTLVPSNSAVSMKMKIVDGGKPMGIIEGGKPMGIIEDGEPMEIIEGGKPMKIIEGVSQ